MIWLALLPVALVWFALTVLIIRHERHNAAREALAAHRVKVMGPCGIPLVNADLQTLRRLNLIRRRPDDVNVTVIHWDGQ